MQQSRVLHGDVPRDGATLRLAGRDGGATRPAWWILGWTIGIVMVLWGTGILEFSMAQRRFVDWIGGLTVLTVLVTWVRSNARALAVASERSGRPHRLQVRVIRSHRPPPAPTSGPDITPWRRRAPRGRSS
jgi:hypothetical protein